MLMFLISLWLLGDRVDVDSCCDQRLSHPQNNNQQWCRGICRKVQCQILELHLQGKMICDL